MLTLEKFRQARETLSGVIAETKLVHSGYFSKVTGNQVYLKPENMQVTGAYKVRGAYYKVSLLSEEQKRRGLITASAGNHAQGVAYAAQVSGLPATIVMPTTTPLVKVNNTKDYGATVVLQGGVYDECYEIACSLASEHGYTFIHPFNDLDIAAGQGTIAYEIFQNLPDVDVILVPIGGGGMIAGIAALAKLLNPHVRVIGVEPKGAAAMYESVKAGKIVTLPKVDTIADGVAVRTAGEVVFPLVRDYVDDILLIDDSELVDAFLDIMEKHKMVVENAGLLTVAALHHLPDKGKNVVSVLSGGNMDVITIASLVQHGLINRSRVFTFSVRLPDRPGELLRVAEIIAAEQGNIIKLEHNQFVSINRAASVELQVTLEAFGHSHKKEIIAALCAHGYDVKIIHPTSLYNL
jgi:threonine dehydratase